ncbi:hypothetical protein [Rubritalea tangerina]|uniref:hypothetical protein n=1 Tax=Rubritalea tangerina TaxID=430798 RepID=UPI00361D8469
MRGNFGAEDFGTHEVAAQDGNGSFIAAGFDRKDSGFLSHVSLWCRPFLNLCDMQVSSCGDGSTGRELTRQLGRRLFGEVPEIIQRSEKMRDLLREMNGCVWVGSGNGAGGGKNVFDAGEWGGVVQVLGR